MKFGVLNFLEHPMGGKTEHRVIQEQLETLRAAEDLGFDYLWAPEHHFTEYGFCASPMLMLAAMASITKRIRLASGVVVLPFNDPIRIAEEAAVVDLMSNGRLELGVGRGFHPTEFRGFGVEQAHATDIFDEALQIIKLAWTREKVAFKGKHFNIEEHAVRPKPLQQPYPTIWLAAVSKPSFELAGASGYNLLFALIPGFHKAPTVECLHIYKRALCASGYSPDQKEIAALCVVYCGETTEQARRDFGAPMLQSKALICGNPEYCINQIEKIAKEYGITQLVCWTRVSGLEHPKIIKSLELFGNHVIPYFRSQNWSATDTTC